MGLVLRADVQRIAFELVQRITTVPNISYSLQVAKGKERWSAITLVDYKLHTPGILFFHVPKQTLHLQLYKNGILIYRIYLF